MKQIIDAINQLIAGLLGRRPQPVPVPARIRRR
jgi:hypothetical protein